MRRLPVDAENRLAAWLNTPRGRALAASECRQLRGVLPHLIGHRFLQVGAWGFRTDRLDTGRMLHAWVASPPGESHGHLHFDGQRLPVASRSMDAVVLPHTLERCASPRQLLREVDRVLCDRGQVALLGFNPLAPAALAQRAAGAHPTADALYGSGRVCDWLELLDFEVVHGRRYGVGFPYLPAEGVDWSRPGKWRVPAVLAQAYLLVARKRVLPGTPVSPTRRVRTRVAAAGLPAAAPHIGSSNSEAA